MGEDIREVPFVYIRKNNWPRVPFAAFSTIRDGIATLIQNRPLSNIKRTKYEGIGQLTAEGPSKVSVRYCCFDHSSHLNSPYLSRERNKHPANYVVSRRRIFLNTYLNICVIFLLHCIVSDCIRSFCLMTGEKTSEINRQLFNEQCFLQGTGRIEPEASFGHSVVYG